MSFMDALSSIGAAGTAAVITVTFIHPIDVVKTRLQVSGEGTRNYKQLGSIGTIKVVAAEEGIAAFWNGIGAAWLREASYTSLRIGLYGPIKKVMGVNNDSHFFLKFSAGSLAGALGSMVGNPFDILKTQAMAKEGKEPPSLAQAARAIHQSQGISGFYKGLEANIMRAMVLNGTKMGVYDQCKGIIKDSGMVPAGIPTDFCAAFSAGFFMSVTVSPFDNVRTALMNQKEKVYDGFLDCVTKILKKKGPQGFYAGFFPIWARFAPTTCLQLVIFEQLKPIFGLKA